MDAPILDFPEPIIVAPAPCIPSLAKKMARVMGEITRVEKNGRHPHHGYQYATSDDVFQAVRLAMAKHNLAVFPNMVSWRQEPVGKQVRTYGVFEFTLVCGDTGESKVCHWQAEADDTQDKGINKVATAALKNFLLKAFVMSTGEDAEDTEANPTPGEMPMTRVEFVETMRGLGYSTEEEMAAVLQTLDILHISGLKKYETMLERVKAHKANEAPPTIDASTGEIAPETPPAASPLKGVAILTLDRAYSSFQDTMTRAEFDRLAAKVDGLKPSSTEKYITGQVKAILDAELKAKGE